jgi:hypothetical protein
MSAMYIHSPLIYSACWRLITFHLQLHSFCNPEDVSANISPGLPLLSTAKCQLGYFSCSSGHVVLIHHDQTTLEEVHA